MRYCVDDGVVGELVLYFDRGERRGDREWWQVGRSWWGGDVCSGLEECDVDAELAGIAERGGHEVGVDEVRQLVSDFIRLGIESANGTREIWCWRERERA